MSGSVRFLGSLEVHIIGAQRGGCGGLGPTVYTLQISVAGSSLEVHYLKKRYSDIARLHARLRPRFPGLPPMPPKSVFRRRVLPSFMVDRQRLLEELLTAMIALDPELEDPDLNPFLGEALTPSSCLEGSFHEEKAPLTRHVEGDAGVSMLDTNCGDNDEGDSDKEEEEEEIPDVSDNSIFAKISELRAANARLEAENAMVRREVASHDATQKSRRINRKSLPPSLSRAPPAKASV